MSPELLAKRHQLADALRAAAPVMIAFSGGVDSACLLAEAHRVLGSAGMLGVIADSPSLPRAALREAQALAESIGVPLEIVQTAELGNPEYANNPINRCYFCKAELFAKMDELAAQRGFGAIAYGENADDMRQVRPGRLAATEFSVIAPLRDAGLSKAEVRELSRSLGLPTADAPAQPCLSSRIPHGTPVTREALAMVEAGEAWVRSLGFRIFRVRHLTQESRAPRALVQISPTELAGLPPVESRLIEGLQRCGYASVEIDPAGYRG